MATSNNLSTQECEQYRCLPKQCGSVQRLIKYLRFHRELEGAKNYDALLNYFNDSKNVLDDWHHVLFAHLGDQLTSEQSQQQFELIYDELMKVDNLKECTLESCAAFTRNSRNRETLLFQDNSLLSFYVDLLDTIHCHLIHSFDCGCRLRRSNFLPDDHEDKDNEADDDEKVNRVDPDDMLSSAEKTRAPLKKIGGAGASTVTHSKFVTDMSEQQIGSDHVYSFGYCFQYPPLNGADDDDEIALGVNLDYVWPKYNNLQDEIVNNKIETISPNVFRKVVVENAEKTLKSDHAKRIQPCDDHDEEITAKHLQAVILYCKFTKLPKHFSQTFRRISGDVGEDDVKGRNREYVFWSRLLRQAVWCFGDNIDESIVSKYYHGISPQFVFSSFVCEFKAPTSLTVRYDVAARFATNGIVLELQQCEANLKYLNCAWLSCFSNEDERLLIGDTYSTCKIYMQNILCLRTGKKYKPQVHAFTWFNYCIRGEPAPLVHGRKATTEKKSRKASRKDCLIIKKMFEHCDAQSAYEHEDAYTVKLFNQLRENVNEMTVSVKHLRQHYGSFTHLLFADDEKVFRFGSVCNMFRNCEKICIVYDVDERVELSGFWEELLAELKASVQFLGHRDLNITLTYAHADENVLNKMKKAEFVQSPKQRGDITRNEITMTVVNVDGSQAL